MWLREINPAVMNTLFSTGTDKEIMHFLGLPSHAELAFEKDKFSKGITTFNRSFTYFQLLHKTDERIIGWCGFHTWMIQHFRAEIGYTLFDESLRRQGFMGEAIAPIIHFGFTQMNLNRIEAMIGPQNTASIRLVQRLGFKKEGLMRQHYCKNGIPEDSAVFALLKEEYTPPANI